MRIDVLTLFPEVMTPFFTSSIVGRAQSAGVVSIHCTHLRDFGEGLRHNVDDRPFGGGPGMVMMCGPLFDAVEAIEAGDPSPATRILLTPQGERFHQAMATEFSKLPRLLLICGHYEGFDERIRIGLQPREVSIGDFVLSGGEVAAMAVVDAVVRLLPGALGDETSHVQESFSDGLLEYPQYTRPREFRGMQVPEVLLSGNHARIEQWRRAEALRRTQDRRPDLLNQVQPSQPGDDVRLVDEGASA